MEFKDKTKYTCGRIVTIISFILFVAGVALVGIGASYFVKCEGTECSQENELPQKTDTYTEFDPGSILPTLAVISGLFCIITSILGCLSYKCMKPYTAGLFAIFALAICATMIFAASVTSGKGPYLDKIQEEACKAEIDGGLTTGEKIKTEYTKMVDRMMCSAKCPCPPEDYPVWKDIPLEKLEEFERMDPYRTQFTDEMIQDLDQNGFEAKISPLFFMQTNPDGSDVVTVDNFKDCYEKNLKGIFDEEKKKSQLDESMKNTMKYVDDFFGNGGYEFLSMLEKKYDCASMCHVPLFWLTKDVSEGPPTKECVSASIESLSDEIGYTIAFSISGVLLLIAVFGSCPLCSDFTEEFKQSQNAVNNEVEMVDNKRPDVYQHKTQSRGQANDMV